MQTSRPISAIRRDFREGALDFLWRQWTQLGVAGTTSGRDEWAIDPEALLVYSLDVARRNPRLFDEILDWLVLNAALVSTQRVRNLLEGRDDRVVRSALTWAANQGAAPLRSWQGTPSAPQGEPEHLFTLDGRQLHIEAPDPIFESFGLLRPVAEASGKSQPPNLALPANIAIRLRMLFGLGTRAEVVRVLLTAGAAMRTTQIATAATYARRNVADTLEALDEAGVVASTRRGRAHLWGIDPERWAHVLGVDVLDLPRFVDWQRLFSVLRRLDDWFEADAAEIRTDYLRASSARQLLADLEGDLSAVGVEVEDRIDVSGSLAAVEDIARTLLELLGVAKDQHPTRQHVVSKVVLEQFTDDDGVIAVYDRVLGEERRSRPKRVAFVNNLIGFRAQESEELWGTIEARLPEVFEALTDHALLDDLELIEVAKDCIVLHWARNMTLVELYKQEFQGKLQQVKRNVKEKVPPDEAFFELFGLHPAGPEARALIDEFIERRWTERFADGRFFRDVLHNNFEEGRRRAADLHLEVAEARESEFLISDNAAPSFRRGHSGEGPLQGVPWDQADSIGMPLSPRHRVALGKKAHWFDLNEQQVANLNRRQVVASIRFVFFRPSSSLRTFVEQVPPPSTDG